MSNSRPNLIQSRFRMRAIPLATTLLLAAGGVGAGVDISTSPLLTGSAVAPNVMFVLDDSGSMQWEVMPDDILYAYYLFPRPSSVYGASVYDNFVPNFSDSDWVNVYLRSSTNNSVFYDPLVVYTPWAGYDGSATTSYGNVSPTSAPYNPVRASAGTLNLTVSQSMYANWVSASGWGSCSGYQWCNNIWPATFYVYKGSGSTTSTTSYVRYQLRGSRGYRKDLSTGTEVEVTSFTWGGRTRTVAQELQNFANWFSYYRSRVLAARGGASNAFAQMGNNYRVGFATINGRGDSKVFYIPTTGVFEGENRRQWFQSLLETAIDTNGTPLRTALKWVGEYYSGNTGPDPWLPNPKVSCRQSFTILTTDGYYNDGSPGIGNSDNTAGSTITASDGTTKYKYAPAKPYQDGWSDTLGDIAMEYWKKDLQTSAEMVNNVPASTADPAFWQHMVTFGLSIGVQGTLDPSTDLPALQSGTKSWPNPSSNAAKIDDLWHAAVNSRGTFVAAKNPKDFADGLRKALFTIGERVASASSVSGNSTLVSSDSLIFQGKFFSGKWTGDVVAFGFNADGTLSSTETWKASEQLPAAASRNIYTWNGTAATAFSGSTIASLVGSIDLLNYIRGDTSEEEGNGGAFRTRSSRLGDIVNSSPVFVGKPANRGYERYAWAGASSYQAFREAKAARKQMVYVGANDGMLHAFEAKTGKETFAYIPSELLSSLKNLADPKYVHRFYVDGEVQVADVYVGGAWKSVLFGVTGRGGKSMFAIDVTDPTSLGAGSVMWEFSDASMGNVLSKPTILRLNNGKWVVAVGNGYNSSGDKAQLLLVDIETGTLTKAIDTGVGGSNGLAGVGSLDSNFDGNADYLYAGDILGNLWKFDASSSSSGSWKVGYSKSPLFSAVNASGQIQPITATPTLGIHPGTFEPWVFFGTGKYISSGDPSTTQVQSWYGLRDVATISGRSKLVERKIVAEGSDALGPYRLMSRQGDTVGGESLLDSTGKFVKSGWYVDLKSPGTTGTGERMFSANWWVDGLLFGSSLIPSGDACSSGATGWVMAMDPWSGGRPEENVFDNSKDGKLDASDLNTVGDPTAFGGNSAIGRNGWQIGNGTQLYGQATGTGSVKTTGSDAAGKSSEGPEQFLAKRGRLSWREFLRD